MFMIFSWLPNGDLHHELEGHFKVMAISPRKWKEQKILRYNMAFTLKIRPENGMSLLTLGVIHFSAQYFWAEFWYSRIFGVAYY